MKKSLKIFLLILGSFLILLLTLFTYVLIVTSSAKLDKDKLINMERIVTYYDKFGNKFAEESGGVSVTNIEKIPTHVKNAFIAIEDKRFYQHKGVDYRGLFRATLNNIKSFSFKQGASTISQQLIKNTHLSNKKTFNRKLLEIKLAKQLEKTYTKDEILEKYLNTIYFGNGCYGITSASKFYFNKPPEELNVNEGATLAGIIKAPSHYSPLSNPENCNKRKNVVLTEMFNQGYVTKNDYEKYKTTQITIEAEKQSNNNFLSLARKEFNEIIKNYPYQYKNLNVYTGFDPNLQEIIEQEKLASNEHENATLILDKSNKISAFSSTCALDLRQPGSTLKPILVYAPAIETDTVYSCSPILDEKTNFNGYSPSNFNEKYYGYVSVKESLAKSLNTCSVKLLNYVGVEKAKSYAKKTDINFTEQDNSLCLALGALNNGVNLVDLTSSYNVFLNKGEYKSASCIDKITTENAKIVYKTNNFSKQIFSEETIDIMNDMLLYTVTNGTAKKLSYCNFPIYAKTGTVGTKDGNTDAYTISYTSDYILASWCGSKSESLMPNSITGGNQPSTQSYNIWKKIYKTSTPNEISQSNNICKEFIDKISYNENHTIKLADKNAPLRYKEEAIFKKNKLPKETSLVFTSPKIEKPKILVKNNQIKISLCLTQLYNAIVYKHYENKKVAVYDTATDNKDFYIDYNVYPNVKYEYSVIPYYKIDNNYFYGEEIFLEPIKLSKNQIDDWWKNELD